MADESRRTQRAEVSPTELTDEALAARAAKGDQEAFAEIVRRYRDRIYNFSLRYTGNPADAEEVTQEVFLKAYRAFPRFRGDAKLSTWLYQIAKNLCINRYHRGRRRMVHRSVSLQRHLDEEEAIPLQLETSDQGPLEAALSREAVAKVTEAIAQLEPHYRMVLILRDVEGLDYAEIAEVMGIPVGTVKSRLHRARAELAKLLRPYMEGEG